MSLINQYLLEAVHSLPVRTFASLGFKTLVGLTNDSHLTPGYATPYKIQAKIYSPDGNLVHLYSDPELLKPDSKRVLNISELPGIENQDQLVMFSLLPESINSRSTYFDKYCDVSMHELRTLVNTQGHQIEYRRPDGYSAGVLYACGAFNYEKFHPTPPSTLLQAPKCYISNSIDTFLTFSNTCPNPSYKESHEVKVALTNGLGEVVATLTQKLLPFTTSTISIKEMLSTTSVVEGLNFYSISAFCGTGLVLPLIFISDRQENTLAVEHTFGPWVYAESITGSKRRLADISLLNSPLFSSKINI